MAQEITETNITNITKIINIAMVIEYDGSNFYGFQKQSDNIIKMGHIRTIQGVLEKALFKFSHVPVNIIMAGRTDRGVHARHQVINFTTTVDREMHKWHKGVNSLLPHDIVIKHVIEVSPDFNARYDAISRTYSYHLLTTNVRPAILYKKVGWYHKQLDLDKMIEAAKLLIGEKDFSSFRASQCQALNAVRIIRDIKVEAKPELHPDMICFTITANAFLHHMVRNIIGALVYVGNGNLTVTEFGELIVACDRKKAPPTFMADGLYFTHVEYSELKFKFNKFESNL